MVFLVLLLHLAGNKNGFIWGGVVSHKQATNYQNKYDGRVYGTAFNETDLSGYVGLNKQWGYSHLNFSLFNDLQEIPDGSRDSVTQKIHKTNYRSRYIQTNCLRS